jgi:hypothetical protein
MSKTGDNKVTSDWNLGAAGDDVYAALVEAHHGLSDADARRLDVRLILLLANHIGDAAVIRDALAKAGAGLTAQT